MPQGGGNWQTAKIQILAQQEELRAQGDAVDGEVAQERAIFQRQAARGKSTELEFDARMEETGEAVGYWQAELDRLRELRDNALQKADFFLAAVPLFLYGVQ